MTFECKTAHFPISSSACKQWLILNKARPDLSYNNMELDWYDLWSHVQKWTTTPVYDFTDSRALIMECLM